MNDFYKILEVPPTASAADIKKSFRRLSLQHHPDKNNGEEEKFKEINSAYQILSDSEKKNMYDMQRSNPFSNGGEDIGDIFKMFFGGGGGGGGIPFGNMPFPFGMPHGMPHGMQPGMTHGMPRGMPAGMPPGMVPGMPPGVRIFHGNFRPPHVTPPPIIKTVNLTFEQSFTGITFPLEIERWIEINGIKSIEKEKLYIPIPSGIDNDEIIKLEGRGNIFNNIKGDLKISIKINNNTKFSRKGLDLFYEKKLTLKESLTGFSFEIKFLQGQIYTINNSNGKIISPKFKKVVPKLGIKRGKNVGDLIIIFDVIFPNELDKEQIKELKRIL